MVTCKSKNVYFAMDRTTSSSGDLKIMNNIQKKLENAGFKVYRISAGGLNQGNGPNMAYQYTYCYNQKIRNSIIFNLMCGVDPTNIVEAYQYDTNQGDGCWYSQQALKPLGNVAVLGWFYGSYDPVNEENKDKKWTCWYTVRPSETSWKLRDLKASGGRMYNPRKLMDEHGVLCICDHYDKTGDNIANLFIKLVKENMGESSDSSTTSSSSSTTSTTTTGDNTVKTLSEQTINEIYSNAYYQEILTATTDENGAFSTPISLPVAGKYNVNLNFAGSKFYEGSTHTVTIENYNGLLFQRELLKTITTSKYTDGTSETTETGSTKGVEHTITITKKRTYKNGVLENETVTTVNNDDVTLVTPTATIVNTDTTTVDPNKKDPFNEYVQINNDGTPNISLMQHGDITFNMVDITKTYTLSKAQYKEVMNRDSKSCQLCDYIESKYTAFLSQETPKEYQVLPRERWNAIEESIYYYLVKGDEIEGTLNSPAWPETIKVDFTNKTTTIEGQVINWKSETCSYWFVADDQDLGYTCGPTACSVCTQILHNYYSEWYMQNKIHAKRGTGSAPSTHQTVLKELGFIAEIYTGTSNAIEWLKKNKPCVYHVYDHYIALCDVTDDERVLVANSVTSNEKYGPLTGWRTRQACANKYTGSAVRVGLNWTISEEEKQQILNFYKSMGGAWDKKPNTNESLRLFYNRYK